MSRGNPRTEWAACLGGCCRGPAYCWCVLRIRALLVIVAVVALVGCGVNPAFKPVGAAEPPAVLTVSVADGSQDVPVDTVLTVRPDGAAVREVEVTSTATGPSSAEVTGSVNAEGVWTADALLDPGATYVVTARGAAADGAEVTSRRQFTTVSLERDQEVFPSVTPIVSGPFGVAQPIVIQFDLPVEDKAEFERRLAVTSTPAQEGAWGWISDTEVHYRGKEYWEPGTVLHLDARLNGVNAGNGTYGQANRTLDLTIGKRQVTTVDLEAKKATFSSEGSEPQVFPISAGKEGFTTRSGTKVIMEKLASTRMDSETTGIAGNSAEGYDLEVSWALRLTSSGEFFHAAPWNASNFGRVNASHGCTGLSDSDARALYQQSQIGDPVVYTGSDRPMELGNGWSEWNLSWEQWQERSAL